MATCHQRKSLYFWATACNRFLVAYIATERHVPALQVTPVAVYIDADNQSSQGAKALLALLGDAVVSVTIAGNNHGQEVERWRHELVSIVPDLNPRLLEVSSRKQAADIALIMELGAHLDQHIHERERVNIVSRDELLISAAECAQSRGCTVFIAYADSEIPTARSTRLTTLLLPAIAKLSPPLPPATDPKAATSSPRPQTPFAGNTSVSPVLAKLREMCTPQPSGGYLASEVGQALFKLGYDTKAARTEFLTSIPGIEARGTGHQKTWVF